MVPLTVVSGADAVFRGLDGGSLSYVQGRLRDDLSRAGLEYPGVRGSAVITGRPGRRKTDALEVGSGAASASLTPRAGAPDCAVSRARFVDDQARVLTVMPADLGSADTLTVAAADQDQAVRVVNEGRARTCRVVCLRALARACGRRSAAVQSVTVQRVSRSASIVASKQAMRMTRSASASLVCCP